MYKRFNAENMDEKTLNVWRRVFGSEPTNNKILVRLNEHYEHYIKKRTIQCVFCLEYVCERYLYSFQGSMETIPICPKCRDKHIKETFKDFDYDFDDIIETSRKHNLLLDKYGYCYFEIEIAKNVQRGD